MTWSKMTNFDDYRVRGTEVVPVSIWSSEMDNKDWSGRVIQLAA